MTFKNEAQDSVTADDFYSALELHLMWSGQFLSSPDLRELLQIKLMLGAASYLRIKNEMANFTCIDTGHSIMSLFFCLFSLFFFTV